MKISFVGAAVLVLFGAVGCASQAPSNEVASLPGVAPVTDAPGPSVYNSDNRPTTMRSGLNSDPYNPNGAPGAGPSSIVP